MRFKDANSSEQVMSIVLHIAFVVYLTVPVFALSAELYRRPSGHVVQQFVIYGLIAILVVTTARDRMNAKAGHWERVRPWKSFALLLVSVGAIYTLNEFAGGAYGTYHVIYLLPIAVGAVMGNVTMIVSIVVVCLAGLGLNVYGSGDHDTSTIIWTLVDNAAAWSGAAAAIHLAVKRLINSIYATDAVAQLASVASQADRWPEDAEHCLPLVATAVSASQVILLSGLAGTEPEEISRHMAEDGDPAVPSAEVLADGVHRALDTDRTARIGNVIFVPRRTASGLVIVLVAVGRPGFARSASRANAAVAGQLLAGIVDRISLIGGLQLEVITDPLTGLANRRGMQQTLERMIAHARRVDEPFSIALMDLDHFKQFNDTHGHLVGDRALREFAERLQRSIRAQDLASRYGGEEFCLLLPSTDIEGAGRLVGELRRRARAGDDGSGTVLEAFPASTALTFSAGVAQWDGDESIDTLLSRADTALYRAKGKGRDLVELAA